MIRLVVWPLIFWIVALAVVRVVLVPPEDVGEVDPASAREAAAQAGAWIMRGQHDDGSYTYEYDRQAGTLSESYNIVRHAGVTMALYQIAGRFDDPEALASADRGLAWMLDRLVRHDGWAALSYGTEAKLGATALMAVALAERRLATGDTRYDDVMRDLGEFMVAMQRPDGGFYIRWFFDTQEPDRVNTSLYYPGESLWALALLHEALPDEGFDQAAWDAADFISLRRDEVEDVQFPPLNDHWAAYGLAEMVEWGLEEHHIDYARRLAGRFSLLIRFEAQKSSNSVSDLIRGEGLRGAALGTWVEGTAALWRLASEDERMADLRDEIETRARTGAAILVERQVRSEAPPLEAGAWFAGGVTRMDDQQHAISGLIYTADAMEGRSRREPDGSVSGSVR